MILRLLRRAGWAPLGVFLVHRFVFRRFGAYARIEDFDVFMHLFGGVAMAFFFSQVFRALPARVVATDVRWVAEVVVVVSLTTTAAVGWEVAEFLSDTYLGTASQRGVTDTMTDLLLGVAGGALYVAGSWWRGNLGTVQPL